MFAQFTFEFEGWTFRLEVLVHSLGGFGVEGIPLRHFSRQDNLSDRCDVAAP